LSRKVKTVHTRDLHVKVSMKCISLAPLLLLPLLVACGGGSSSSGQLPALSAPAPAAAQRDVSQISQVTEAQTDLSAAPQPQYVPSANDLLYVSNAANASITVYHHDDRARARHRRIEDGDHSSG
jgi:hypothetical protein